MGVRALRRITVGFVATALAVAGGVTPRGAAADADPAPPPRPVAGDFHPGSLDLGDPLAPGYGNGGYDVSHYGITLRYGTTSGHLVGRTVITARLTENLSRFNLDFALPAQAVTVNGVAASFKTIKEPVFNYGKELVVTPAKGLPAGTTMTVIVTYAANPADVKVAHYSEWNRTVTGITAWDEPNAAAEWWFPGNDYPSDKATFDVTVTTSRAAQAITNGRLISRCVHGPGATSHWRSTAPMSPHLSFLNIGKYDVVQERILGGTPAYFAYEHTGSIYVQRARRDVSQAPAILARLQHWFGAYPFPVAGAIVSQTPYGTAFESQTRPTYTALYWKNHSRNIWAVVHELSHQWYGDDVGMSRWRHIWLAEGFATYAEWLWSGAHGRGSAEQLFEGDYQLYPRGDRFWRDPVIHPDFALANPAYERGAMTLQALRNKVGTPTFFAILHAWTRLHRDQAVPTAAFEALAERLSGQDLGRFFEVWLESAHRPAPTPRNGFPKGFADRLVAGTVAVPSSLADIARTDRELAALAGRRR
jgi:aminopeptidase N